MLQSHRQRNWGFRHKAGNHFHPLKQLSNMVRWTRFFQFTFKQKADFKLDGLIPDIVSVIEQTFWCSKFNVDF